MSLGRNFSNLVGTSHRLVVGATTTECNIPRPHIRGNPSLGFLLKGFASNLLSSSVIVSMSLSHGLPPFLNDLIIPHLCGIYKFLLKFDQRFKRRKYLRKAPEMKRTHFHCWWLSKPRFFAVISTILLTKRISDFLALVVARTNHHEKERPNKNLCSGPEIRG